MSTNYPPPPPPQKPYPPPGTPAGAPYGAPPGAPYMPPPGYGPQPYGYMPQARAPNPIGQAGFWLAFIGILSIVINMVMWAMWGVEAQRSGVSSVEGIMRYVLRKIQRNPAFLVIRWGGLGMGMIGMIVSIVGLRQPGAKRGLAVTGLVFGILCSICAVLNMIDLFAVRSI